VVGRRAAGLPARRAAIVHPTQAGRGGVGLWWAVPRIPAL